MIMGMIATVAVFLFANAQYSASHGSSLNANGQVNTDPKYGPVKIDDTQYKQCEGSDLDFKSLQGDNLLSVSHDDPACL